MTERDAKIIFSHLAAADCAQRDALRYIERKETLYDQHIEQIKKAGKHVAEANRLLKLQCTPDEVKPIEQKESQYYPHRENRYVGD
jgi:hypothetical protein